MRKNNGAGKKIQQQKQTDAIDEVEELLKLTQDDLLLKLNVNSHLKSKSRSDFISESSNTKAIHPDLDLRFQALRLKKPSNPMTKSEISGDSDEDIDNLFARFAALKGPSNATITTTSNSPNYAIGDDDDEEDEVSKIVNWAIDAARLDPSPSSDIDDVSDDDNDVSSDDDHDDDDDDDREVKRKGDGKKKVSKK